MFTVHVVGCVVVRVH